MAAGETLLLIFGGMFLWWMLAERRRRQVQDAEIDRLHHELVQAEADVEVARELARRAAGEAVEPLGDSGPDQPA